MPAPRPNKINNFSHRRQHPLNILCCPVSPGKAVIGPITLEYGNKTYKTDPHYRNGIPARVRRRGTASSAKTASGTSAAASAPRKAAPAQAPADMPPLERDLYNLASCRKRRHKTIFMVAAVSNKKPVCQPDGHAGRCVFITPARLWTTPLIPTRPFPTCLWNRFPRPKGARLLTERLTAILSGVTPCPA